jgi:ribosome-associated toxin RatA of RatAB toxin-antitoxin module
MTVPTFIACALMMAAAGLPAAAIIQPEPIVRVTEEKGLYAVAAEFSVPQSATVVMSVLSDYEAIPRFMPDIKTSRIIERGESRALVEQHAVAQFLLFSRRIELLLEIDETPARISFKDRSGKSFRSYEGAWQVVEQGGSVAITYTVAARPAFDVPEFILKRLMKRDATRMIANLRREFAARGAASRQ